MKESVSVLNVGGVGKDNERASALAFPCLLRRLGRAACRWGGWDQKRAADERMRRKRGNAICRFVDDLIVHPISPHKSQEYGCRCRAGE